jgi:hypothetical protein
VVLAGQGANSVWSISLCCSFQRTWNTLVPYAVEGSPRKTTSFGLPPSIAQDLWYLAKLGHMRNPFILLYIFTLLLFIEPGSPQAIAPETVTITAAPGYSGLRACAVNCVNNVAAQEGCTRNDCLCRADILDAGITYVSSCALNACQDFSDATSAAAVFSAYCAELGSTSRQPPTKLGGAIPSSTPPPPPPSSPSTTTSTTSTFKSHLLRRALHVSNHSYFRPASSPTKMSTTSSFETTSSTQPDGSVIALTQIIPVTVAIIDNPSNGGTPGQSHGLSQSDRIALGTSLGIGIPGLIVAVWMCVW